MARYLITVLAKKPPPNPPGPGVGQPDPEGWFDTGIDIKARTRLRITATGTITWTPGAPLGPEGWVNVFNPACVDPNQFFCKLIGLIVSPTGPTQALAIGSAYQGVASITGRLYLVVNDMRGTFGDNGGQFDADIWTSTPTKLKKSNQDGRAACQQSVYGGNSLPVNRTPLSLLTGEKFEDVTDLSVATPAGMLTFTRTYRQSQLNQPGPLMGAGWTHNHDLKISAGGANQLIAALDGGTKALFLRQGMTSLYVADAGASAQIDAGGSGISTYTLTSIDKTEFVFDDQGRIRERRWANNEVWTYTYYAAPHFAAGLLQDITDDYGHQLKFSYIDNALAYNHKQLWRVGDQTAASLESGSPTGRYVEFGYVESRLNGILTTPVKPLLYTVRDVRSSALVPLIWTYHYYGQQPGETDSAQGNWLTRSISPSVDVNGDGVADGNITLKEVTYTLADSTVRAITQRQGKFGSDPFLLSTDYLFQAQGQPLTTETTAGRTTTHYFAGEVYEGSANPAGHKPIQGLLPSYRPEFQADAIGNVTALEWSSDGKLLNSVTDALNHTTNFSYNDDRLSTVTDPENRVTEYTYGDVTVPRQPTVIKVKTGATVLRHQTFTYDAKGRTTSEKLLDPTDGTTVLQEVTRDFYPASDPDNPEGYGFLKQITQKFLPSGNDTYTRYWYDSAGRVKKMQQSSHFGSCEFSFTLYDAAGNVIASICNFNGTEPTTVAQAVALFNPAIPEENIVTTHEYDSLGRRVKTTTYAGASWAKTSVTLYDALSRVWRTIANYTAQGGSAPGDWVFENGQWKQGPGGSPISFGAENNQNLIADTFYNARGQVRLRRDGPGNVILFGYDAADRLVKTVQNASVEAYNNDYVGGDADPDLSAYPGPAHTLSQLADRDIISTRMYDPAGNLVETVDARGIVSFTVYDTLNRPVKTVQNAKAAATLDLNANDPGYVATNDPRSEDYVISLDPDRDMVTKTEYDAMGRVIRTRRLLENRDPLEQWDVTLYGYDSLGRQVRGIAHASQPEYNIAADPDLHLYALSEDADQDLLTRTTYDATGRVEETLDVNGSSTRSLYDGLGRVVRTVVNYNDQDGSNPANWVFEGGVWKQSSGGTAIWHGLNFDQNIITDTVYDSDGRVESTRNVDGRISRTAYDLDGRQKISIQNYVPQGSSDPVDWEWVPSGWEDGTSNPITRTSTYTPGSPYAAQSIDDLNIISQPEYDSESRVLQTRDVRGNLTRFVYDSTGRQVKTVANYVEQTYMSSVIDPSLWVWRTSGAGTGWHLSATIDVLVANSTDKDQNLISQTTYDLAGRVFSTRDMVGNETRFVYDAAGRRTLTVSNYVRQNNASSQEVDPSGWRWSGGRWEFLYNITGPVWNAVAFGTGQDQNLIGQTAYDKAGQVLSTRDARGIQTTFTYDTSGRRLTATAAAGSGLDTTAYTGYDKAGRVRRTIQNYRVLLDGSGNLISPDVRNAGDWVFNPTDHGGNQDQNLITEMMYDAASRQTQVINPSGDLSEAAYYKDGQTERLIDPAGIITVYRYDKLRRRVLVVQDYVVQSNSESQAVDPFDWRWSSGRWEFLYQVQPVETWNAVAFGTDNDQNMIVQVTHNRAGQIQNLRDPRGNLTAYEYDALGRRWKMSNPLGKLWLLALTDVNGTTRTTQTYPGLGTGGVYTFTRDTNRRGSLLTVVSDAPGATPDLKFAYDLAGNRTRMSEYCGSGFTTLCRDTFYHFDTARRLTQVELDKDGSGPIGETFTHQYDVSGLRTKLTMTYPGDREILYTYDPKGRMVTLTDYDNQTSTFAYDAVNRHILTNRPNGILTRYRYDPAGRLRDLEHGQQHDASRLLRAYRYTVDARGNRTQVKEVSQRTSAGSSATLGQDHPGIVYEGNWKVDNAFRVSSDVTAQLGVLFGGSSVTLVMGESYDHSLYDVYINGVLWNTFDGYAISDGERSIPISLTNAGPHLLQIRNRNDKNGESIGYKLRFKSLTAQTMHDTQQINYTYDALARLKEAEYVGGSTCTYGFDVAGNLVNNNGVTQTFNAANQMTGDGTNTYEYDPNGNLWKTNTVVTHTWDRKNRLLSAGGISYHYYGDGTRKWKNEGGVITWYFYDIQPGLPLLISAFNNSDYWRYMQGPRGTHSVEVNTTGAWSYLLEDGLRSVRQQTSSTGAVNASANYEPLGEEFGASGTFVTDFKFAGEQVGNNGLSFNRARYYNPVSGGWLSLDPFEGLMERPMSLNGYAYVEGNVVNATDANGMCMNSDICLQFIGDSWRCNCLALCGLEACEEALRAGCRQQMNDNGLCIIYPVSSGEPTAQPLAKVIYFGGSNPTAGITTPTDEPFARRQAAFLSASADQIIPYTGTSKLTHAQTALGVVSGQDNLIIIGYSAGADSALIFSDLYREEKIQNRASGNLTGLALLGPTLDGGIGQSQTLRTESEGLPQWQRILNSLLGDGTRVLVLDDEFEPGRESAKPNWSAYTPENSNYCYVRRSDLKHYVDPSLDATTNPGTNNNSQLPSQILDFLRGNSSCPLSVN